MIGKGYKEVITPYGVDYYDVEAYEIMEKNRKYAKPELKPDGEIIKGDVFSTFDTEFRDVLNCTEDIKQVLRKYPKEVQKSVLKSLLKKIP